MRAGCRLEPGAACGTRKKSSGASRGRTESGLVNVNIVSSSVQDPRPLADAGSGSAAGAASPAARGARRSAQKTARFSRYTRVSDMMRTPPTIRTVWSGRYKGMWVSEISAEMHQAPVYLRPALLSHSPRRAQGQDERIPEHVPSHARGEPAAAGLVHDGEPPSERRKGEQPARAVAGVPERKERRRRGR